MSQCLVDPLSHEVFSLIKAAPSWPSVNIFLRILCSIYNLNLVFVYIRRVDSEGINCPVRFWVGIYFFRIFDQRRNRDNTAFWFCFWLKWLGLLLIAATGIIISRSWTASRKSNKRSIWVITKDRRRRRGHHMGQKRKMEWPAAANQFGHQLHTSKCKDRDRKMGRS